jgi:hypothetical protein
VLVGDAPIVSELLVEDLRVDFCQDEMRSSEWGISDVILVESTPCDLVLVD